MKSTWGLHWDHQHFFWGEKKEQTETKIMQANGKMLTTVFMSRGQAHSKAEK